MDKHIIKVAVTGAGGRMGKEVIKMVLADNELSLVAAVDTRAGEDVGTLVGASPYGITVTDDLELALVESHAEVLIDFTTPHVVMNNIQTAIRHKVRPVVGTTGFAPNEIDLLDKLCKEQGIGGIIAPN